MWLTCGQDTLSAWNLQAKEFNSEFLKQASNRMHISHDWTSCNIKAFWSSSFKAASAKATRFLTAYICSAGAANLQWFGLVGARQCRKSQCLEPKQRTRKRQGGSRSPGLNLRSEIANYSSQDHYEVCVDDWFPLWPSASEQKVWSIHPQPSQKELDFQKGCCELGYQLSSQSKLHVCANSAASLALLQHLLHGPLLAEPSRHKIANETHWPRPPHIRSPTPTYLESDNWKAQEISWATAVIVEHTAAN